MTRASRQARSLFNQGPVLAPVLMSAVPGNQACAVDPGSVNTGIFRRATSRACVPSRCTRIWHHAVVHAGMKKPCPWRPSKRAFSGCMRHLLTGPRWWSMPRLPRWPMQMPLVCCPAWHGAPARFPGLTCAWHAGKSQAGKRRRPAPGRDCHARPVLMLRPRQSPQLACGDACVRGCSSLRGARLHGRACCGCRATPRAWRGAWLANGTTSSAWPPAVSTGPYVGCPGVRPAPVKLARVWLLCLMHRSTADKLSWGCLGHAEARLCAGRLLAQTREVRSCPRSYDAGLAASLWDVSAAILKLS